MNDKRPTRTRFLVRRVTVLSAAILSLFVIFQLITGKETLISRVITPPFDCVANSPLPQTFVDSWTAEHLPVEFNATVIDLVEGCTYTIGNSAATFPTASTGKVIIAIRVLEMVSAGLLDYTTIYPDLDLMLTESNNESANRLFLAIGENIGVNSVIESYALTSTSPGWTWGTIQTTSSDQALLLEQVLGTKEGPLPETPQRKLSDRRDGLALLAKRPDLHYADLSLPLRWDQHVPLGASHLPRPFEVCRTRKRHGKA